MILPESYIVSKFYLFAGAAKYNRFAKTYVASCPICREGKSWLKKQRLNYVVDRNNIHCFNCGWTGTPYRWIKEVSGLSRAEIIEDSLSYETYDANKSNTAAPQRPIPTLPGDCVNLFDNAQVEFYRGNEIVQQAVEYINKRRLNDAVNKPSALYVCFDKFSAHNNRLIIPFIDSSNKIVFYQSRGFLPTDTKPKYLSKCGGERSIFNLNKLSEHDQHVFVFEGPINACFMKNSVAIGGIQEDSMQLFSTKQAEQMDMYCKFYQIVWILDSQWVDRASYKKTQKLIEMNQRVFIWPKELKRYKDFNDICIAFKLNEVSPQMVLNNTFEGSEAREVLKLIPLPN